MKVLALVTDAFGGYGGIAQYNRDLLAAVAAMQQVSAVEVLPRIAPDPVTDLPPKLQQGRAIRNRWLYTANAAAAALRFKPDVIFSGHLYHGVVASALAEATGSKLVSQLHGTEAWGPIRRKDRSPLMRSDLVLTVSRDTLGRLKEQVRAACRNGVVVANTVGTEYAPGDRAAARLAFGITGAEQVLLSVGRLDPREGYKGHDKVISLLPRLRAEGRDITYLIAGVGLDRKRLESLTASAGAQDMVRFLGKVAQENLPELYRATDLFVLPSTGEGFGIVYLEAMACGTPALGLNAGGAPDALGDGELGWMASIDELAETIARALDAPRRDAHELHAEVTTRFGQDTFRGRIADLMLSLDVGVHA